MCKSFVDNYLKGKRQPRKIDFDLQRNIKICLEKNGKTMCLVTDHQCICFMGKPGR